MFALVFALTCGRADARPVVAIMTDFGLASESVGLCHGAMLAVNPEIEVVDLCHNVNAYDIKQAALILRGTTAFPKGAVFVCVVDPDVGTSRSAVALRTRRGLWYVGPNNGLFTYVVREQGIETAAVIDPALVNPAWKPGTFDGRDLFSPAGAILATAQDLGKIGRAASADAIQLLDTPKPEVFASQGRIVCTYVRTDAPYGNVWTDATEADLAALGIGLGDSVTVSLPKRDLSMQFVISFGHVPKGKNLAYLCSSGTLAFAINEGNFAAAYRLKEGQRITVRKQAKGR